MATVNELLTIARKQLSVCESPSGSNNVHYNTWYYGREVRGSAYPWCMVFVQWVFDQVGVKLPLRTASCGTLMNAAKAAGCWVTAGFRPGDVVIYDFPGGADTDHCGIVEMELPDYGVQAIEGNTSQSGSQSNGGMVCRKNRPSKYIVGAVRPVFEPEQKEDDSMTKDEFKRLWQEVRKDLQDNDSSQYSQEARTWAVQTGLIQGGSTLPDGSPNYMWEDLLTREQMVTLLLRFAKAAGLA